MNRGLKTGIAFLLILVTVFACFSCGNGSQPTDQTTEPTTEGESTEMTTEGSKYTYTPVAGAQYNGIVLPEAWPPRNVSVIYSEVIDVPYLREISEGGYHPEDVIIDIGRQLFVDDFLIDSTTLTSTYHTATPYEGNPILQPVTPNGSAWGKNCKHGGLYYDSEKKIYQLWLNVNADLYYFQSKDGINWSEGEFCMDAPGYATVVKNPNPKSEWENYVLLLRRSNGTFEAMPEYTGKDHNTYPFEIYTSRTGRQDWTKVATGGQCNDATSMFYNPFRQKWVASLRKSYSKLGRVREYFECDDITQSAAQSDIFGVFWMRADAQDIKDPVVKLDPQIYSISCVAYESIMLGGIQLMLSENKQAEATGIPKITDIHLAYSRDGFYFSRPSRDPILRSSQQPDTWDRGYLHEVNTLCLINGDELWFYYFGYKGDEARGGSGVANSGSMDWGSLGLAKMRRDGFVSMDGTGELLTRRIVCTQNQKYLFVNAKADSLKAEILDEDGNVIPGYGMEDCVAFSGDSTCSMITWKGGKEISDLSGRVFRIRFSVENGEFYSFWVSATEDGNSNGYYAGGLVSAN